MKLHTPCRGKGMEKAFGDIDLLYNFHEWLYAALVEADKEPFKIVWVTELKSGKNWRNCCWLYVQKKVPEDEPPEIEYKTADLQLFWIFQECVWP
jgi:hypothetical protein